MINADLDQFVATGILGPFDSTSTRTQIEQFLGSAETGGYPDHATYGHLSFDLADGIGPPCRIQIAFPHPSHMMPANPNWTDWIPPTCFDDWPDRRFHWRLGRFIPGLTIEAAIKSLDDFIESEMIMSTKGLRILHNSKSGVDLMFECDPSSGAVTLTNIVAHPQLNAG